MAETWLEQSNPVSDLPPADSPVVNPFAIMSDQHRNSTKRGTMNQSISTLESVEATTTKPTTLADSEGDHSPPSNKQRRVTAVTTDANSRMDQVRVEISNDFTRPSANSNPNEDLKMPTKVNLRESSFHHSPRLREIREAEAKSNAEAKVHVPYGAKFKKKILGLLTIISLASNVTLSQYKVPQNETYTDGLI